MSVSNEQQAWPLGANNRVAVDRLPEGSYRDAVNLDPSNEGKLSLRAGYVKNVDLSAARGAVQYGDSFLIADGTDLLKYDISAGVSEVLATIAGAGFFAGAELGGVAYVCTPAEGLVIRGSTVAAWAVESPTATPSVATGQLKAGTYRVAVTAVTADGRESGASPSYVILGDLAGLTIPVVLPAGAVSMRCYCSVENGETLYFQDEKVTGSFVITNIRNNTERLTTENMSAMPIGEIVTAHNGHILVASGKVMYISELFMPHLYRRVGGFVQYPAPITNVISCGNSLFVTADKTYHLTNVGSPQIEQRVVLEIGGVAGTGVVLGDTTVAWMSKYGQVTASQGGAIELPNKKSYAPPIAESGTAGVVECNGNQMIVTTMRGRMESNGLGLRDSYDMEIL